MRSTLIELLAVQSGLEQIIGDYNQLRNDVSKRKSTASSTGKDAYSKLERIVSGPALQRVPRAFL